MGDTIFGLSTPPGRGAIAIVRVSGASAREAVATLAGAPFPAARRASVRRLRDRQGHAVDDALLLWFPGPASFTGEDMAEFHLHGGRAVVQAVFGVLTGLADFRPAEPGEFTRRAVENGRLDLTQAEAIADLIDAETPSQLGQALAQYDGGLSRLYEGWRERLIHIAAHAEAGIDFADEDLPEGLDAQISDGIAAVLGEIDRHMDDTRSGEITREGLLLTVIGPPNAGKSSLVNALARRDIAIVSDTPGTTRDVVEARLDLGGYAVTIADTAGLRDSADGIEQEGMRRALARAESGDIVLLLLDGTSPDPLEGLPTGAIENASLVVWNKIDLFCPVDPDPPFEGGSKNWNDAKNFSGRGDDDSVTPPRNLLRMRAQISTFPQREGRTIVSISVRTGEGMDMLVDTLIATVRDGLERPREFPLITRARHRNALEAARDALQRARTIKEPEFLAEELRLALRAIGRITGRVDIEDLLDVVFKDFCIGK